MSLRAQIDGVGITPLREIRDERGAVLHMLRADAADFAGFGECYFSEIAPGAVKAWKRHHRQTQNIAVPIGRVRFVIYDDRAASVTRGAIDVFDLGRPDAYVRLRIPPLLIYGFACTSAQPALMVNCATIPHDPAESDTLKLDALSDGRALDLLRGLDSSLIRSEQ
jgi:dTDP-4-dehydrorhamnose 3,5-epimerase